MRCLSIPLAVITLVIPLFAGSNPVPYVNQPLLPASVAPGGAGLTLKVEGSGFVPGAVVNWNGVPLGTKFVNHNRLKAAVPATNISRPSTATVTVTNPAPGGGISNPVFFTVTRLSPSLTFSASSVPVGTSVAAVAIGDFNNDGKQDMAVVNIGANVTCFSDGYVSILLGQGDGTFTAGGTVDLGCLTLGAYGLAATVADFNQDGRADLAITFFDGSAGGPGIAVYLGNGDGTFAAQPSSRLGGWDGAGTLLVGDFNSDGKLDLALPVDVFGQVGLWVFLGNGDGTFAASPIISYNDEWGNADGRWMVEGDFNGDGILDIAADNFGSQPIVILMGNGDGTFSPAPSQPLSTLVTPGFATAGDFNGDGILDLAFADSGATSLTVLMGNGDGTFTQKAGQPDAGQTTSFIATADFNGDGKLDLALVDSANAILIYLGNGDGTFRTSSETPDSSGPLQLGVADFTADGRLDLAVANSADGTVSLFIQSPSAIFSSRNLNFGKEAVSTTSSARRIYVTNSGSAHMRLASIVATGDFSQTNTCKAFLAINRSCHIDVVFQPTAEGLRTGSVTITDNAAGSPQVIELSGMGVASR